MMTTNSISPDSREELIKNVADLNEDLVINIVKSQIEQGINPFDIVEACKEGMQIIGYRYEQHEYYLAGLIMGSEIFQQVMMILDPFLSEKGPQNNLGTILLGTVAGDIHDIGKNILQTLVTSYGFTVHDIGIDISPQEFIKKAYEYHPDIIGLSGLLTSSYESMRETIHLFRTQDNATISNLPIVIGGSTIDQQVCLYVGADHWANDAMIGLNIFKEIMDNKNISKEDL